MTSDIVFRASKSYLLMPVIACTFLSFLSLFLDCGGLGKLAAILFALIALWQIWGTIKQERVYVAVNEQAIWGRIWRKEFHFEWQEIIALWKQIDAEKKWWLWLGTEQGAFHLSLEPFYDAHLLEAIKHYASPEAIHKESYKNLASYRNWLSRSARLVNEPIKSLRAKKYGPRWGLTLLGLGLFIALIIGIDGGWLYAIGAFVPIALLGILFWNIGLLKMDIDGIEYCQWPKRNRIAWEEIECVDIDNIGYVFRGSNKELSIPSFPSISGRDVSKMQELLNAQIVQRNWQLTGAFKTLAKEWLDGANVVGLEEDC